QGGFLLPPRGLRDVFGRDNGQPGCQRICPTEKRFYRCCGLRTWESNHAPAARQRTLGRQLRVSFIRRGFGGQGETKTCAAWRVVGGPQTATVRFDNRPADAKSHAGAV